MKSAGTILLVVAWLGVAGAAAPLEAQTVDFTGHYELADVKADHVFSLDVTQHGSAATLSFSASMNDGSGAAPDGDGQGEVKAGGALEFHFTDSFGNEGTGSLVSAPGGYRLQLDAGKVADARPLRFYGPLLLKKTADKPAAA